MLCMRNYFVYLFCDFVVFADFCSVILSFAAVVACFLLCFVVLGVFKQKHMTSHVTMRICPKKTAWKTKRS